MSGTRIRVAEESAAPRSASVVAASEATTARPPAFAPNESIPVLAVGPEHLRQLSLDPYAGFLLSLMDGTTTVETLLDVWEKD